MPSTSSAPARGILAGLAGVLRTLFSLRRRDDLPRPHDVDYVLAFRKPRRGREPDAAHALWTLVEAAVRGADPGCTFAPLSSSDFSEKLYGLRLSQAALQGEAERTQCIVITKEGISLPFRHDCLHLVPICGDTGSVFTPADTVRLTRSFLGRLAVAIPNAASAQSTVPRPPAGSSPLAVATTATTATTTPAPITSPTMLRRRSMRQFSGRATSILTTSSGGAAAAAAAAAASAGHEQLRALASPSARSVDSGSTGDGQEEEDDDEGGAGGVGGAGAAARVGAAIGGGNNSAVDRAVEAMQAGVSRATAGVNAVLTCLSTCRWRTTGPPGGAATADAAPVPAAAMAAPSGDGRHAPADAGSASLDRWLLLGTRVRGFPLHSQHHLDWLHAEWTINLGATFAQPLDQISSYFGEGIALYFAWLEHYTKGLVLPAVLGVLLFFYQRYWADGGLANWPTIAYSVFLAIWTSAFGKTWRRRQARIAFEWGLLGHEAVGDDGTTGDSSPALEPVRPQHRGRLVINPATGHVERKESMAAQMVRFMIITVPVMALCVAVAVCYMALVERLSQTLAVELRELPPGVAHYATALAAGNATAAFQPLGTEAAPCDAEACPAAAPVVDLASTSDGGETWWLWRALQLVMQSVVEGQRVVPVEDAAAFLGVPVANITLRHEGYGDALVLPRTHLRHLLVTPQQQSSAVDIGIVGKAVAVVGSLWPANIALRILGLLPTILFAVGIPALDAVNTRVAQLVNDAENHRTETEHQDALVRKRALLAFVNNFVSLVYIAFVQQDLPQLRSRLMFLLLWKALLNNAQEVCMPLLKGEAKLVTAKVQGQRAHKRVATEVAPTFEQWQASSDRGREAATAATGAVDFDAIMARIAAGEQPEDNAAAAGARPPGDASVSPALPHSITSPAAGVGFGKSSADGSAPGSGLQARPSLLQAVASAVCTDDLTAAQIESSLDQYDQQDDIIEMLVQFGQVTLFSAVFPLAAVLALANNVVEIHSDSYKLLSLQRPHPQRTKTLGAWLHGFEACAFAAVASNVGLVYVAALQSGDQPHLPTTTLLLLFVALEHGLLLLKTMFEQRIADVTLTVTEEMRAEAAARRQLLAAHAAQRVQWSPVPVQELASDVVTTHSARPPISAVES